MLNQDDIMQSILGHAREIESHQKEINNLVIQNRTKIATDHKDPDMTASIESWFVAQ